MGTLIGKNEEKGNIKGVSTPQTGVIFPYQKYVILSYNELLNKPSINGVELKGNKTSKDLKITAEIEKQIKDITKNILKLNEKILTLDTEKVDTTELANYALISILSLVATTGDYNDLLNKPTLFSGSYPDLTNNPYILRDDTEGTTININTLYTKDEVRCYQFLNQVKIKVPQSNGNVVADVAPR